MGKHTCVTCKGLVQQKGMQCLVCDGRKQMESNPGYVMPDYLRELVGDGRTRVITTSEAEAVSFAFTDDFDGLAVLLCPTYEALLTSMKNVARLVDDISDMLGQTQLGKRSALHLELRLAYGGLIRFRVAGDDG